MNKGKPPYHEFGYYWIFIKYLPECIWQIAWKRPYSNNYRSIEGEINSNDIFSGLKLKNHLTPKIKNDLC